MATWQGASFGGWAPFESMAENWLNTKSNRKNAEWNAWQQQMMSAWQWKSEPKLRREGLEKAGYNPLLALGDLGGSPLSVAPASAYEWSAGNANFGDVDSWNVRKRKRVADAEMDMTIAESNSAKVAAEVDKLRSEIELEALEDFSVDSYDSKGELVNPTRAALRDAIRKGVHNEEYKSNWTRSLLGDIFGFGGSAVDSIGNSARAASALRRLLLKK